MSPPKYIDNIPGSLYLVDDVAGHHESGLLHEGKHKEIILDPTPSVDVNDPLNWSRKRKLLSVSCVYMYTLTYGMAGTVIYSLIVAISTDTGIPTTTLIQGTGYLFGLLGWFGPFILPLGFRYGARPSYLFSMLSQVLISVWTPYISTSGEWLASRIIQGCCGPAIETLVEISIAQVFFSHERGRYIGIYAFILFGSNYLSPALSGFVYEGIGWHWTMYWAAFICVFGFFYLFFFQEETNYNRVLDTVTTPLDETKEKGDDVEVTVTAESRNLVGVEKSFIQKLKIYNGTFLPWKDVVTCMWRPWWIIFRLPLVGWAGFQYGASLVNYNILNATLAPILSSPPYSFRTEISAQLYWAPLIGVCIGGLVAGRLGDWFAIRMARRNAGVREPEHKLWILAIPAVFVPAGLILWGVGAVHHVHFMGLAFGIGFIGLTNGLCATISLGYALDCYRELGTEVMIAVIIVRNTLSFAIGYGISPWLTGMGQQNAFISCAFIGMAVILTFLPIVAFGKRLRMASMDIYWEYTKTAVVQLH